MLILSNYWKLLFSLPLACAVLNVFIKYGFLLSFGFKN